MKLQLLIPQYKETEDQVRPMLESIAGQQGADLKRDIEVLMGNDGSDTKLSEEFLGSFPFSVRYISFEHSSPAGCRGHLFDMATADYVMFCDADDMFLTNLAFHTIFSFMEKGFDALVCDFLEEVRDRRNGQYHYISRKRDPSFVHGKVYRRQFLLDNHIVWKADMSRHEDGSYNTLALKLAKRLEYCDAPLYLWKWRDDSLCRSDPLYVLKTYTRMIYSNWDLVREFRNRGMEDEARYQAAVLVYGTYFMLNKPIWLDPMNAKYRNRTETCFREYYKENRGLFLSLDTQVRKQLIAKTKQRVLREGVLLEKFTFDDWIRHIEGLEGEV